MVVRVSIPQKYLTKVITRYSSHPRARVKGFYTDESGRVRPITAPSPEQRLEERKRELENKIMQPQIEAPKAEAPKAETPRPPIPPAPPSYRSSKSKITGPLIIDPLVRTKYKEWLQATKNWRNRKMLPIGSLQKYYESRREAFVAEGGDADVFDDLFYRIDMAQAVDGWLDLDKELKKHFITVSTKTEAQKEKEAMEKYKAYLEEEKRLQELYEEYIKSFDEENQGSGVGA